MLGDGDPPPPPLIAKENFYIEIFQNIFNVQAGGPPPLYRHATYIYMYVSVCAYI